MPRESPPGYEPRCDDVRPPPASGRFDGPDHRFAVRVYFEDTDLSGVVYHANYLRWFERARTETLRLIGIEQRALHDAGEGAYAIAELSIRYRVPARLDDAVIIETRAEEVRAASCRMRQRALRIDAAGGETLLAEARMRVGFVGPDGHRAASPIHGAVPLPQSFQLKVPHDRYIASCRCRGCSSDAARSAPVVP